MGFVTAIDDFGAGYSGLSLFARVMPDVIKLDRALIDGVGGSAIQKAIVGNLFDLCSKFDIKVIAEGVETETDYRALAALGVTLFQGYYFSRPVLGALAGQDFLDVA
jgi:EAL domain-containing protein (putative c-di-GMP-specific phosphodiesterase class I)